MKINKLDNNGFYIEDHVEGELPNHWTSDLVGNGYYKAQYQNAKQDIETGEYFGGTWVETSGEDVEQNRQYLVNLSILKKNQLITEASTRISILNDRIEIGQDKIEELRLWKIYRLEVDDIDTSIDPITWPVIPNR